MLVGIELVADNKKGLFIWESKLWTQKTAILDAVIGTESIQAIRDNIFP
jgi:hypothetical protein